jgi:hypothetical protein
LRSRRPHGLQDARVTLRLRDTTPVRLTSLREPSVEIAYGRAAIPSGAGSVGQGVPPLQASCEVLRLTMQACPTVSSDLLWVVARLTMASLQGLHCYLEQLQLGARIRLQLRVPGAGPLHMACLSRQCRDKDWWSPANSATCSGSCCAGHPASRADPNRSDTTWQKP